MTDTGAVTTEFRMPSLGADMVAGRLVEWLRRPGDHVSRGDVIAEVETDKGVIEVEVFTDGVVERLLVEPGAKVPVGTPLAVLRGDGEARAPAPAAPPAPATPPAPGPPAPHVRASPLARRVATELGVDLAAVAGTGPGGAIRREDVEAAARRVAPAPPSTAAPAAAELAGRPAIRNAIAAAMSRSKREIPHYYLSTAIDLGRAVAWLTEENLARPIAERLVPAALLIKAVARCLHAYPELNGWWRDGGFVPSEAVHVGVAVALRRGGVVAPALHDVDRRSVGEVMLGLRDLVARARGGGLRSSELADGTITVTALGERGVDAVFGVIFPPQVAIVGFGTMVERPWVVTGQVVPRPVVTATLAGDHRVSDGHRGALFLDAVTAALQRPEEL